MVRVISEFNIGPKVYVKNNSLIILLCSCSDIQSQRSINYSGLPRQLRPVDKGYLPIGRSLEIIRHWDKF